MRSGLYQCEIPVLTMSTAVEVLTHLKETDRLPASYTLTTKCYALHYVFLLNAERTKATVCSCRHIRGLYECKVPVLVKKVHDCC